LQPLADALGAVDEGVDLGQLALRQLAKAVGHRLVAGLHQLADLGERESGAFRDVDHREPAQHRAVVAALAADALGRRQQPDPLVVAVGRVRWTWLARKEWRPPAPRRGAAASRSRRARPVRGYGYA
jgi:hypothetical protein